jgi:integrase
MEKRKLGSIVIKNGKLYARVRFTDDSGKKRDLWRTANSKKDAKEKIKELIEDSESKTSKELDASRMTFNHLAKFYQETYLHEAIYVNERKVSGIRNIKPYYYSLKTLKAHFGYLLIQSIQHSDILKYKLKRLKTPLKNDGQRGITGVNRELQLLRRILNIALRQGWINRNPFHNGDSLISMADEPQRSRILSFAEETRLFAVIDRNPRFFHLKGIVLIALDCGFRKKEILTLCRKDIDLLNQTITIQAFNAKSAKSRMVGMTTRVSNWLSQYENLDDDDRIFPIADCKAAWTKALKLAGIEDYHFHDNRHTCISRMVKAGLNHTEIMRISGHATLSCLFRYINTDSEAISRVATVLDNYLTNEILHSDASQLSDFVN